MPPKQVKNKKKTFKFLLTQNPRSEPSKLSEILLLKLLKNLGPGTELEKETWAVKKLLSKDERKKKSIIHRDKKMCCFGLNECVKQLKNGNLDLIFLNYDLNPWLLAAEIFESAQDKGAQVLLIENLKELSKKYIGFPSSCIGVKKQILIQNGYLDVPDNDSEELKAILFKRMTLKKVCNNENRKKKVIKST